MRLAPPRQQLLNQLVRAYISKEYATPIPGSEIRASMTGLVKERVKLLKSLCPKCLVSFGSPLDNDAYRPTAAGALASDSASLVLAVLDAVLTTLKLKQAREPTFRAFSFAELQPHLDLGATEVLVDRVIITFDLTHQTDRFDGSTAWKRPLRLEEIVELPDANAWTKRLTRGTRTPSVAAPSAPKGNARVAARPRSGSNRDDFPEAVKRILGDQVGWCCSNPGCRATTKGPHSDGRQTVHVGVAAHIHAAAPSGPRFDQSQTPEQRAAIENGIYLCETCAARIDKDPLRFTADILRTWKTQALHHADAFLGAPAPSGLRPQREAEVSSAPLVAPTPAPYRVSDVTAEAEMPHPIAVAAMGRPTQGELASPRRCVTVAPKLGFQCALSDLSRRARDAQLTHPNHGYGLFPNVSLRSTGVPSPRGTSWVEGDIQSGFAISPDGAFAQEEMVREAFRDHQVWGSGVGLFACMDAVVGAIGYAGRLYKGASVERATLTLDISGTDGRKLAFDTEAGVYTLQFREYKLHADRIVIRADFTLGLGSAETVALALEMAKILAFYAAWEPLRGEEMAAREEIGGYVRRHRGA